MVNKGDTDMIPVLREIAAGSPEGLFLPIFPEEAGPILRQSSEVDGLAGLVRIGGGGLLVSDFLALPESEGFYFAGPTLDFGSNVNEATGRSGDELNAAYLERYGEHSTSAYLAHAYDATTILLRAIEGGCGCAGGCALYRPGEAARGAGQHGRLRRHHRRNLL